MVLKQFVGGGVDDVTSRIDLRTLHAAVPTLLRQADQFGLGLALAPHSGPGQFVPLDNRQTDISPGFAPIFRQDEPKPRTNMSKNTLIFGTWNRTLALGRNVIEDDESTLPEVLTK